VKRCQTCNRTFTDPNLSFCTDDGTPLVQADAIDETTVVSASSRQPSDEPPITEVYQPRDWQPSDYRPPGFQPEPQTAKRKTWLWVVGILVVVAGGMAALAIAAAIIAPAIISSRRNENRANANVSRSEDYDSNLNTNSIDSNSNTDDGDQSNRGTNEEETTPAPTDSYQVLADLTAIEHEWTAANINADTKKLDRILADDYVGTSSDGQSQGKAEYLRTIKRDTSIQKWDFEDLRVALQGDRATLTGVIRLELKDREAAFRFVDKFVWRDGRWQAVGSEVSRLE